MNFLFHFHLAVSDLDSETSGIGAMLPDIWRMADRRVRARRLAVLSSDDSDSDKNLSQLLSGIEHHLDVDEWFHQDPLFIEGEKLTRDAFRDANFSAGKMLLMAHIAWELCLDGALLRRLGVENVLADLRRSFNSIPLDVHELAVRRHLDPKATARVDVRVFLERLERLFQDIQAGPWITGYAHGPGLARRLGGVRRRLRLEGLSGEDEGRLGDVFDELLDEASRVVNSLADSGRPLLSLLDDPSRQENLQT